MKQKKWWEENTPKKMYRNDYICALIEHAFSWTFMMTLPITICIVSRKIEVNEVLFALLFCLNWAVHIFIDNLKANKLKINLCTDQSAHLIQIIVTWLLLVVIQELKNMDEYSFFDTLIGKHKLQSIEQVYNYKSIDWCEHEIETNGNNCTKIRFKHKDVNYCVQETVEEIINLLGKGTSLYHIPF